MPESEPREWLNLGQRCLTLDVLILGLQAIGHLVLHHFIVRFLNWEV